MKKKIKTSEHKTKKETEEKLLIYLKEYENRKNKNIQDKTKSEQSEINQG
tara:strand:- start:1110 stop:1259 length:150 start_codon:yes stop_codon:yes gene_type:complete